MAPPREHQLEQRLAPVGVGERVIGHEHVAAVEVDDAGARGEAPGGVELGEGGDEVLLLGAGPGARVAPGRGQRRGLVEPQERRPAARRAA
jgi:hypothetical protein